ncbi:unnamed protein product [Rotaria sp. Silwood1]|nr:unnamed protein product [Rotaria sp. Silwood1]CAF1600633.1 unnamed protein product [Rotaria sp. Silwood1]
MNGSSTTNGPTNEQLIGKFQVINLDKLPINTPNNHDDVIPQISTIPDESGGPSRFQMIRVDRNFGRGRWKVNDYEPPENISNSIILPINTIENESINISNNSTFANLPTATIPNISSTVPTVITGDSNVVSSAALAATAASAAAAAATAFQQQQQMALKNAPTLVPTANVPPTAGLLHAYPPGPLPNQPYLLPNHPQFGYYPFYPTPYSPYATSWAAAALAASNPFLPPPTLGPPQPTTSSLPPTTNINDPIRLPDTVSDINGENTVMSSINFPNATTDHLQNAQLAAAAAAAAPFLYAAHPSHTPFVPQASSTTSPYATIPSYHPVPSLPTILPQNQASQTFPISHMISINTNDIQLSHQPPLFTSPKYDTTKNLNQQSSTTKPKPLVTTVVNGINNDLSKSTQITDLISSSPLLTTSDTVPPSLISPININVTNPSTTTSLGDIWTYTTSGSPLNLTQTAQTAAVTAAAAMGLLNNENNQNTEIANEILKELTTPTKQNNTTDIDNKISAAMDLVKMHLLSAVRDEVTELRQQIRILNERINSAEHENAFLRQHVPSEIYAQYIPTFIGLSSSNEPNNSSTTTSIPLQPSSQPVLMNSLSSNTSSLVQQPTSLPTNVQQPLSTTNLSST